MKIAGAVIIFIASTLLGAFLGERKRSAAVECEAFLELFRYVKNQIKCFDTPTKLIWRGFENPFLEQSGFMNELLKAEDDEVYFDAFSRAFGRIEHLLTMSNEAKSLVRSFGSTVGKSSSEEQLSGIDYFISELSRLALKAKGDAERDAKLYLTMGLSFGAAIFIMLI